MSPKRTPKEGEIDPMMEKYHPARKESFILGDSLLLIENKLGIVWKDIRLERLFEDDKVDKHRPLVAATQAFLFVTKDYNRADKDFRCVYVRRQCPFLSAQPFRDAFAPMSQQLAEKTPLFGFSLEGIGARNAMDLCERNDGVRNAFLVKDSNRLERAKTTLSMNGVNLLELMEQVLGDNVGERVVAGYVFDGLDEENVDVFFRLE
ncbi:MAG: hypothetical protein M1831_005771 [Alyxoria varia]|nr:MAG: hypothetical protein M1831_005771 [Alyxoria varia]